MLRRAHVECAASGGRWPLPQTGPGAAGRQRGCSRVRSGLARNPLRYSRYRIHPGAQGPVCGEQETGRTWLPAPLVWTWVRAYRQLHAGNAGLRPATTSLPVSPCSIELVLPVYTRRSKGCAHARCALLYFKLSVKKGESFVVHSSTTFPRLSRVGELRNSEDAANLHVLFRWRSEENCGERALYDISRHIDCCKHVNRF